MKTRVVNITANSFFIILLLMLYITYSNNVLAGPETKQVTTKKLLHTQVMDHEPHPAYLPVFAGNNVKFIQGISKSGLTNGVCYHLCYGCMDTPKRVMEGYEKALIASSYKITEKRKEGNRLMALRPSVGASVMVNIQPFPLHSIKDTGYKTYYQVRYVETFPIKEGK